MYTKTNIFLSILQLLMKNMMSFIPLLLIKSLIPKIFLNILRYTTYGYPFFTRFKSLLILLYVLEILKFGKLTSFLSIFANAKKQRNSFLGSKITGIPKAIKS